MKIRPKPAGPNKKLKILEAPVYTKNGRVMPINPPADAIALLNIIKALKPIDFISPMPAPAIKVFLIESEILF
jgi:hypothetical protein